QRGHDDTYRKPSNPVEEREARLNLGIKDDDELYVVDIGPSRYYVSTPFTSFHVFPVGRGTKCFYAYCPGRDELVLFKDTWRKMQYEKEGNTLRMLNLANIPNIPTVLDECDIEGYFQTIEAPFGQAMQHYVQVTDEIGRPLSSFKSSWEMINAVCDAILGMFFFSHKLAWEMTNILHRDISSGNILIYDLPRSDGEPARSQGLLIDLEMAKTESSNSLPRTTERTGTHQFIALELLNPGRIKHGPQHDLESFIYVLLWITIRHAKCGPSMGEDDKRSALEFSTGRARWQKVAQRKKSFSRPPLA
ncbi:hypothetical protein BT69DRAFT_1224289, partial [Atractiella rhizophila]